LFGQINGLEWPGVLGAWVVWEKAEQCRLRERYH